MKKINLIFSCLFIVFKGFSQINSPAKGKEALYQSDFEMCKQIVASNPFTIVCEMENMGLYNQQTDMILKSLENYFVKGYSFSENSKIKSIPVIVLFKTNTPLRIIKNDCYLIKDSTGMIFNYLIYKQKTTNYKFDRTYSKNFGNLYLLDNKLNVKHHLSEFHSFGEELRPLEVSIHKIVGDTLIKKFVPIVIKDSFLKAGSIAPDFNISSNLKLSELVKTKKVILSFYPAPFTGAGLRYESVPYDTIRLYEEIDKPKKFGIKVETDIVDNREFYGGCGGQAMYFEESFNDGENTDASKLNSFKDTNVVILYISEGNSKMLQNWSKFLGTEHLTYINDNQFQISQLYGSYNYKTNLNKRSVFVIGKDLKIKLVNYDIEYFYNMNSAIKNALEK